MIKSKDCIYNKELLNTISRDTDIIPFGSLYSEQNTSPSHEIKSKRPQIIHLDIIHTTLSEFKTMFYPDISTNNPIFYDKQRKKMRSDIQHKLVTFKNQTLNLKRFTLLKMILYVYGNELDLNFNYRKEKPIYNIIKHITFFKSILDIPHVSFFLKWDEVVDAMISSVYSEHDIYKRDYLFKLTVYFTSKHIDIDDIILCFYYRICFDYSTLTFKEWNEMNKQMSNYVFSQKIDKKSHTFKYFNDEIISSQNIQREISIIGNKQDTSNYIQNLWYFHDHDVSDGK